MYRKEGGFPEEGGAQTMSEPSQQQQSHHSHQHSNSMELDVGSMRDDSHHEGIAEGRPQHVVDGQQFFHPSNPSNSASAYQTGSGYDGQQYPIAPQSYPLLPPPLSISSASSYSSKQPPPQTPPHSDAAGSEQSYAQTYFQAPPSAPSSYHQHQPSGLVLPSLNPNKSTAQRQSMHPHNSRSSSVSSTASSSSISASGYGGYSTFPSGMSHHQHPSQRGPNTGLPISLASLSVSPSAASWQNSYPPKPSHHYAASTVSDPTGYTNQYGSSWDPAVIVPASSGGGSDWGDQLGPSSTQQPNVSMTFRESQVGGIPISPHSTRQGSSFPSHAQHNMSQMRPSSSVSGKGNKRPIGSVGSYSSLKPHQQQQQPQPPPQHHWETRGSVAAQQQQHLGGNSSQSGRNAFSSGQTNASEDTESADGSGSRKGSGPYAGGMDEDYEDDQYGEHDAKDSKSGDRREGGVIRSEKDKNLTKFVQKLYSMITHPASKPYIDWSPAGNSFVIPQMQAFSKAVLGQHFKHSNFSSFVRQLNMYGFGKVKTTTRGQKLTEDQVWEFSHPAFLRGRQDLLETIRRRPLEAETLRREATDQANSLASLQAARNDMAERFKALETRIDDLQDMLEEERAKTFALRAFSTQMWEFFKGYVPGGLPFGFPPELMVAPVPPSSSHQHQPFRGTLTESLHPPVSFASPLHSAVSSSDSVGWAPTASDSPFAFAPAQASDFVHHGQRSLSGSTLVHSGNPMLASDVDSSSPLFSSQRSAPGADRFYAYQQQVPSPLFNSTFPGSSEVEAGRSPPQNPLSMSPVKRQRLTLPGSRPESAFSEVQQSESLFSFGANPTTSIDFEGQGDLPHHSTTPQPPPSIQNDSSGDTVTASPVGAGEAIAMEFSDTL